MRKRRLGSGAHGLDPLRHTPDVGSARTTQLLPGSIRLAAFVFVLSGLGIGLTTPFVIWRLAREGELPMTPFGFRLLAGPAEQFGPEVFTVLCLALVAVCVADVLGGLWLWQGRRRGATLGLATSPLLFALGLAFAVPFMLLVAPIRAAGVLVGRASLG